MKTLPSYLGHSPPPLVAGILGLELVAAVVLLVLGIPWLTLLAYGGPAIAFTLALLSPTVQELGRRQPKLQITAMEGDGQHLSATSLRPWPIDVDRIVTNEVADAQRSAEVRHSGHETLTQLSSPFAIRPSEADHEQAKDAFKEEVERFGSELRRWLTDYQTASRAHADTFDLTVQLLNAASGAHGEAVTVVLDLPDDVVLVEDRPTASMPPERPTYEPPQPQKHPWIIHPSPPIVGSVLDGVDFRRFKRTLVPHPHPAWKASDDGRRLESSAGDVHPGRRIRVGDPLLLRVFGQGSRSVTWTAYSKAARRAASGQIILEVPPDPPRPAFGRLQGITSYPDIPLLDDNGEISRQARSTDPPSRPAPSEPPKGDPVASLREARALMVWKTLGLDPTDDGPERFTVRRAQHPSTSD